MTGLQAGWLVGTKLWVSPIREGQNGADWIELQGAMNHTVGPVAPIMMAGAAGTNVAPLAIDAIDLDVGNISFVLASAGFVFNSTIIATTLIGNVPVNNVTGPAYENGTVPANFQALRSQWETYHTVRAVLSVLALAANAGAAVTLEE